MMERFFYVSIGMACLLIAVFGRLESDGFKCDQYAFTGIWVALNIGMVIGWWIK